MAEKAAKLSAQARSGEDPEVLRWCWLAEWKNTEELGDWCPKQLAQHGSC